MSQQNAHEIVTLADGKTIAGPSIRTQNSDPNMLQVIGDLWQAHFTDGPQPVAPTAEYGVYHDYESDVNGFYRLTLGREAKAGAALANGTQQITIRPGRYARFHAKGEPTQSIAALWQQVWSTPLDRAYTTDFEEYLPAEDPQQADVYIYIALRD